MTKPNQERNLLVRVSSSLSVAVALFAATQANAATELMYAIELGSGNVFSFNSDAPGTVLSSHAITGLQNNEAIQGLDSAPDGTLYGLGSSSRLYAINPNTGAAVAVGGQFATLLNGSTFGMDLGPTGVRVVSDLGQALLINTATGAATVQASPAYAAGDPHVGVTPRIDALAFDSATGTWIAGDSLANLLATLTPSSGALNTIGNSGIDFSRNNGLDFSAASGILYLASPAASSDPQANLYTVNPTTGAVTLVGLIGNVGDNILVGGLTAAVSAVPEPSSLALLTVGGMLFAIVRRKK